MFLKRLSCQGFKSFADKLDFDFDPGVTGVVGPNGCGKSNIVDSVKWVLGDQSAKSLRGDSMQDVIFSGSGTRKPAGMAQVDLVFDNTDRKLAHDMDEVRITRRLYRTGESEYLLNNQSVRLKDIKELFMDTGIGVTAYSIIEQGKVSYLIQANPQQRRLVFEEAAGISKYKARKVEAQRKLQRVDQNLLRIQDVLKELEKQLRSVKLQAGKARHFQEYDQQLREKRATFSLAEYHRLVQHGDTLRQREQQLSDEITGLRTQITTAETEEAQIRARIDALDAERQTVQQQVLANSGELTEKRERIDQSHQQMTILTSTRARELERLAGEKQKLFRIDRNLQTVQQDLAEADTKLTEAHRVEDELVAEESGLAKELAILEAQSENRKAQIIEFLRRATQLQNEIQSLEREHRHLESERERLLQRRQQMETELDSLAGTRADIESRAQSLAELIQSQTQQLDLKQQEASRLGEDQARLNAQLGAAREHRSGLLSRKQTLADLERKLEGVDAGVREVLHRKEQDAEGRAFSYVWGMVADLIAADVAHAALIETALGEFDQYLVVEDSKAMMADADLLADFPGRVPALCVDLLPPFVDGRDYSEQEGFVAYAMNLVRYPSAAEPLVRHLLGHTIIVRSLEDAVRLAQQNPPAYRYVTLSGQLLDPMGVCQMGPAGARTGLISRKSELRDIDQHIAEVDQRIALMQQQVEQASSEAAILQHQQQELRNARADARAAEAENNAARNATQNAMNRLNLAQPELTRDLEAVDARILDAGHRSMQSAEHLGKIEKEQQLEQQQVNEILTRIEAARQRRADVNASVTNAKVRVAQITQQRSGLNEQVRGLHQSRSASEEAVRQAASEAEQAAHHIQQSERQILAAQSRLADLYVEKEGLDRRMLESSRARESLAVHIEELASFVKTHRTQLETSESAINSVQMDLRESQIRTEELVLRIQEELNVDLAAAYAGYQHQEQDWAAVEAEIAELKEKIRRLGNVNLDAIAEQAQLEDRESFLAGQNQDLSSAKTQLEELIEHLNKECRERFTQTFEAVRGHFNEMFRKLFGGGKADVFLEQPPEGQPMDVLEAGIEIQARPPGKELRTNSLLSGGEKTMTAIALLMAIFKSRPAPFAILDEVDAALDEANNERFNRIVSEFLEHTQFIVITHQKPTMSMANVLYGITMQEAGVSKRVSVKFETAAVA